MVEGTWVFNGKEEMDRKIYMVPAEKCDQETLVSIIKEWILTSSTIMPNCWKAYDWLER